MLKHWRIPVDHVSTQERVAKGSFFHVYTAHLRDHEQSTLFCIKQLAPTHWASEARIVDLFVAVHVCAELAHPKVVQFAGFAYSTLSDLAVVTEYMPNGDLESLLRGHVQSGEQDESFQCKAQIALDVIEAVAYLHEFAQPELHGRLRARSVLLGADLTAKLNNTDIHRPLTLDFLLSASEHDGAGWTAPEVCRAEPYLTCADVYSFGVLLTELDTGARPYERGVMNQLPERPSNAEITRAVALGVVRPRPSMDCPLEIRQLVDRCTHADPATRPSASAVVQELRRLVSSRNRLPNTCYWV
ncbi:TPA: hypothetical protein N0F65_010682 [Lagenidium giganteum]|uniref:Protein kinase domain-containing protein n=1 Tax=Lagenidium giganteum TaxID=4803 RepID=A0AAV2Z9S1_9STRA|nr:TPA: hypothetical protein N0F65_010682 [Lagenidium giganteum]